MTHADHYMQLYKDGNISAEHALKQVVDGYNALAKLYTELDAKHQNCPPLPTTVGKGKARFGKDI